MEEAPGRFERPEPVRIEAPPPPPIDENGVNRMKLHPTEYEVALRLKKWMQETPDVDHDLSDFMLAQIAIAAIRDDGESSEEYCRELVHKLQYLKEEYEIRDDYHEGTRLIERYLQDLPGHILDFYFNAQRGSYVIVHDMAKMDPAASSTPEKKKALFASMYYVLQASHPDLQANYKGLHGVVECCGFQLNAANMMTRKFFEGSLENVFGLYPFKPHRLRFVNTGYMVQMMVKVAERIIPNDILHRIQVWPECEVRLDEVYGSLGEEVNAAKVAKRLAEALRLRYENEKTFSLSKATLSS